MHLPGRKYCPTSELHFASEVIAFKKPWQFTILGEFVLNGPRVLLQLLMCLWIIPLMDAYLARPLATDS